LRYLGVAIAVYGTVCLILSLLIPCLLITESSISPEAFVMSGVDFRVIDEVTKREVIGDVNVSVFVLIGDGFDRETNRSVSGLLSGSEMLLFISAKGYYPLTVYVNASSGSSVCRVFAVVGNAVLFEGNALPQRISFNGTRLVIGDIPLYSRIDYQLL
jgi:hypothetical protein